MLLWRRRALHVAFFGSIPLVVTLLALLLAIAPGRNGRAAARPDGSVPPAAAGDPAMQTGARLRTGDDGAAVGGIHHPVDFTAGRSGGAGARTA